jgi:hypothetical protein
VQGPAAGCRRPEVVDGRGERAHGVELPAALGVELRGLDGRSHE